MHRIKDMLSSTALLLLGGGLSAIYLGVHVSAQWLSSPLVICGIILTACAIATLIWRLPIWIFVQWAAFFVSVGTAVYTVATSGWSGTGASAVLLILGVGLNLVVCTFNFFERLFTDEVFPVERTRKEVPQILR